MRKLSAACLVSILVRMGLLAGFLKNAVSLFYRG